MERRLRSGRPSASRHHSARYGRGGPSRRIGNAAASDRDSAPIFDRGGIRQRNHRADAGKQDLLPGSALPPYRGRRFERVSFG